MEGIGGVFWINLDRRTDRRAQMEAELGRLDLSGVAERFSAVDYRPGIVGCGMSHLAVLRLARDRGWRNVLIFEDDFEALMPKEEFWLRIRNGLAREGGFDVLMLSYHLEAQAPVDELFVKVLAGQTASGYIVAQHYYDTLIKLYEWAVPKLIATGEHWNFANDQVWKQLQPSANWLAFRERLGRQRASWSDNAQAHMDYGI